MVRTRIAPAACNHLSLRELQTALMNWLFARSKGGKFIVRIAEADLVRGRTETVHRILDDVRWLDIDWDEGPDIGGQFDPYLQSARRDGHDAALDRLRSSDAAYAVSEAEDGGGEVATDAKTISDWVARAVPYSIRLRLDRSKPFELRDLVHGFRGVPADAVEDPVIQRPDGSASPILTQVVDDAAMRISHVLRPDSEFARSVVESALFQALGARAPRYGHFPELRGTDGKPYSRRHGAFTVDSFKKLGYLPGTLTNYLVRLAWNRRGLGEKFDIHELGEKFHLAGIRKESVAFQFPELNELSTRYICEENLDHLADRVLPYLIEGRFVEDEYDREKLKKILHTIRPSLKCLSEIVKYVDIFFGETVIEPRGREVLKDESAARVLRLFRDHLATVGTLDEAAFDSLLERMLAETGYEAERLLLPIRAALTGVTQGDDLDKIASILGPRECMGKVDRVLAEVGER